MSLRRRLSIELSGLALATPVAGHPPVLDAAELPGEALEAGPAAIAPPPARTPRTGGGRVARRPRPAVLGWAMVVSGVALWLASLHSVDLAHIGRYGLSASLPATWYAALAIVILGAVKTIFARRFRPLLAAAHVGAAVLVVYATIPAVAAVPQYAWTYKHIGVTRSIEQLGSVAPLVDIYHRWPGFFALAALFSRLAGLGDPIRYAAWAEPVFSVMGALLVAALAHTVSRNYRVAALAAMFFVLSAWVAQSYFAPQPLAYILGLTLMLAVLRWRTNHRSYPRWLVHLAGAEAEGPARGWSGRVTLAVVVAVDAVVVVTHQLSPYMVLLELVAVALFSVLRLRWIVLPALALPAAYLLPNLTYLKQHFPLFNGTHPGKSGPATGSIEPWLVAQAGGLTSACLWALALLAVAGLLWRRAGPTPLMVLALAMAPACTLAFGVAYGGEASLRVHYFAAPWLAVLVAWGLVTLPRPRWRAGIGLVALLGVTALFVVAFFGRTALNVIPRDEVEASAYFYAHAEAHSLLLLVNPGFPMRLSARYTVMRPAEGGDTSPNLMARQNAPLVRGGSLTSVMTTLRQLAPAIGAHRYLVFSRTEAQYANVTHVLSFAETRRLESEVVGSSRFRLWHQTANSRIYEEMGV